MELRKMESTYFKEIKLQRVNETLSDGVNMGFYLDGNGYGELEERLLTKSK